MKEYKILDKSKYLITNRVYDNFVNIHINLGLIEQIPQNWEGKTIIDALKYLNIADEKGTKIKSPIEEVVIYKSHLEHLIIDNDKNRKKHLNRAIRTIQTPNLILKNNTYNDYIKLFIDKKEIKPHLQVVKVKSDGSFYVTNHRLHKHYADRLILEGEIIYDLSSISGNNFADIYTITNFSKNFNP